MLHRIWQKHNKYPHEVFAMDERHRTFIMASELIVIDEEVAEAKATENVRKKRRRGGKR